MIGIRTTEVTPTDDVELPTNCGFIADVTGSFEGKLRKDTALTTFNVNSGNYYVGDLKQVDLTGLVNVTKVQIWFCTPTP